MSDVESFHDDDNNSNYNSDLPDDDTDNEIEHSDNEEKNEAGQNDSDDEEQQNDIDGLHFEDDDEDDEDDYQFNKIQHIQEQISEFHAHQNMLSFDEIKPFLYPQRNSNNIVIDDYHRSIPILTKYERTKVIGLRTVQLQSGLLPFIKIPDHIVDYSTIAQMELNAKAIPFIIKRPISTNKFEYWPLHELEII